MKSVLLALAVLVSGCATAPKEQAAPSTAGEPRPIEIMVLGVYHFAGGADVVNADIDSVLTFERQRELQAVADALAAFKPTIVAVERQTPADDYVDPAYKTFTETDLTTVQNERTQIGYRLAHTLGMETVHGVDEHPSEGEPDYFPFGELAAFAEATGRMDQLTAMIGEAERIVAELTEMQKEKSVAELLIFANDGPLSSHDFYYKLFDFDQGERQPGAELQAYWFMRNAKIFSKIAQIAEPGDRVVAVFGAGHKHWLEHFAEATPGFDKVDPVPYLETAAKRN